MKFLNVYCEDRKEEVYINLDSIVMVRRIADKETCFIELNKPNMVPVKVSMNAEDLVRKINGEDRAGIGFRRSI